jgi:Raf kinase inhibitor-like YbhB/YbcL family protein
MKAAWLAFVAALPMAIAAQADDFHLTSSDLAEGGPIASTYLNTDCRGGNLSPALAWSGAPAATRSFAVTVYDPDAPKAGGWWHWLAFDLPAATTNLKRGAARSGLPQGSRQGRNDYGRATYDGPCPPPGPPHRYIFTVWALDVDRLAKSAGSDAPALAVQLQAHGLAQAQLMGTYGR